MTYWDELRRIFDWTQTNVHSTFNICWGAQAALHHFHGVPSMRCRRRPSASSATAISIPPRPICAASRTTSRFRCRAGRKCGAPTCRQAQGLEILMESDEAGLCLVDDAATARSTCSTISNTTPRRLARNIGATSKAGKPIELPTQLFPGRRSRCAAREPLAQPRPSAVRQLDQRGLSDDAVRPRSEYRRNARYGCSRRRQLTIRQRCRSARRTIVRAPCFASCCCAMPNRAGPIRPRRSRPAAECARAEGGAGDRPLHAHAEAHPRSRALFAGNGARATPGSSSPTNCAAAPKVLIEEALYDFGNGGRLLDAVRTKADTAKSVLVVGHNPSIERLAQRLIGKGEPKLRKKHRAEISDRRSGGDRVSRPTTGANRR